ncbi:PucR family transcriptional regulator [Microbacterium sp. NPDC055910]|uniref:PucR family transcriptional regulator n=1 Tax=Microbacterium sp. NPDC055910 TaxID=3345659 RepID=UPI0035E21D37
MTTIAELVADPLLAGTTVVAGESGVMRSVDDVRPYAATRELRAPDSASHAVLVCDEADVTPAYRIDALVRRADHLGAAAILVVSAQGQPLLSGVRLADRLGIPILWITRADPFALTVELAIRLRTPHIARAQSALRAPAVLAGAHDPATIAARATTLCEAVVVLLTSDGSLIAGDSGTVDAPAIRFDLAVAQRTETAVAQPVVLPDMTHSSAWIIADVRGTDDVRKGVVTDILTLVEPYVRAWLVGEAARLDRDAVFLAHLLSSVLHEADDPGREVIEKAASVGWRLQDWHTGIYVVADDPRAPSDRDTIAAALRRELAEQGIVTSGIADHAGGWALWKSEPSEPSIDQGRGVVRALRLALASLPRDWGLVAGVGRTHHGAVGLRETLGEARNAAYLARSRDFRPSVDHSDELGVAQLLATLQQSDVTRAFAESALAPISDPASSHLLATLTAYLQNGGSVVFTAQALNVHRNTVTARLQQLRERLGVDLDDSSLRLALQMAVRAVHSSPATPLPEA